MVQCERCVRVVRLSLKCEVALVLEARELGTTHDGVPSMGVLYCFS